MSARCLVNGRPDAGISPLDRGFLYGEGVFETILCGDGRPTLWREHLSRLAAGCRRLGLPRPEEAELLAEMMAVASDLPRAVVRITLSAGVAARRGYGARAEAPNRVVCAWPAAPPEPRPYREGVRVRICRLRLGDRPELAGLKHLNRLEQVLARREWRDPRIAEGLLFDVRGNLVAATAANVFLVEDGRLLTPALDRCGVAGTVRAFLMSRLPVEVVRIPRERMLQAEEIFLSNAVQGVVPVRAVGRRRFRVGPHTRAAMACLRSAEPLLQPPCDDEGH
jgi:4-amino-4-deoxychorismate lyase